jgi:hypothetical protein
MTVNFRFPKKAGNLLSGGVHMSFSKASKFHHRVSAFRRISEAW